MRQITSIRSVFFLLITVSTILLLPACALFFPKNPNSEEANGEIVNVHFVANTRSAGEDVALSLVSQGISAIINEVNVQLKAEAAKYSAQYSGSASGYFYTMSLPSSSTNGNWDLSTVNYALANKSIVIDRFASLKDGGDPTNASSITADLVQDNDKSVFYLRAKQVAINYAKAKVKSSHSKVDLMVTYTFTASYNDSKGTMQGNATVGTGTLVLPQTPIGKTNNYDVNSNPPRTGFIPSIPFSPIPGKLTGAQPWGNFSVTVVVSEVDNYGAQIEKIDAALTNAGPFITNVTSIAIDLATNNGTVTKPTTTTTGTH